MDERSDAYHDGAEAFRQGSTDTDNPHPLGSDEAMDWFDGFTDASTGAT